MARVLRIFLLLAALGVGLSVIAQTQGHLQLQWQNTEINASPLGTVLLIGCVAVLGWLVIAGIRHLILLPHRTRTMRRRRAMEHGLHALNGAYLALAKGDMPLAAKHQRKAERHLPHHALPLLLGAQIATQQQDSARQQQLLQRMLAIPDARPLAARSLLAEALARDDLEQAQAWAQQALDADPKDADIQTLRIHLLLRQRAFTQAQDQLHRWRAARQITRRNAADLEGLLATAEGRDAFARRDYTGAIRLLAHAVKLRGSWLPALLPLAEAYHAAQQTVDLKKLVEKHWRHAPHPRLSELHRAALNSMAPHLYLKIVQAATRHAQDAVESWLWLAQAAERGAEWTLAQEYARQAVLTQACREAHTMLANLEQRLAPQNPTAAMEQRAKAAAAQSLHWDCQRCSAPAEHWAAECPGCHSPESLRWNSPAIPSTSLLAA